MWVDRYSNVSSHSNPMFAFNKGKWPWFFFCRSVPPWKTGRRIPRPNDEIWKSKDFSLKLWSRALEMLMWEGQLEMISLLSKRRSSDFWHGFSCACILEKKFEVFVLQMEADVGRTRTLLETERLERGYVRLLGERLENIPQKQTALRRLYEELSELEHDGLVRRPNIHLV